MKTKNNRINGINLILLGIVAFSAIFIVTNCSKSGEEPSTANPKIKYDTICAITLPPADSLTMIKSYFGDGILKHMQSNYNKAISDFTILNDSICFRNDTTVVYKMNIQCTGFTSKSLGIMLNFNSAKKKNSQFLVTVHKYIMYTCSQGDCTGNCQLLWSGSYYVCFCTNYGECHLNQTVIYFIF